MLTRLVVQLHSVDARQPLVNLLETALDRFAVGRVGLHLQVFFQIPASRLIALQLQQQRAPALKRRRFRVADNQPVHGGHRAIEIVRAQVDVAQVMQHPHDHLLLGNARQDGRIEHLRLRQRETIPNLTEFLGEMSYSGWQDLGVSCLLLVEGPSDVTAIGQFLVKHRMSGSVLMLPLGGSTMINERAEAQLEELKRITTNIFALIDSERSAEDEPMSPDRQAFIDACGAAHVDAQALERRALENYLSDRAIKRVKGPKYRQLGPYEKLADCDPAWGKNEGYKIAAEMTLADLDGTDLGEFLDKLQRST